MPNQGGNMEKETIRKTVNSTINTIKKEEVKQSIIERCGEDPVSDGLQCPDCGCDEAFKNKDNPDDTGKWFFMIRAFKVDDWSFCNNCGGGFRC